MKTVINKEETYKIILKSVNMICNAVSSTLGPCGNNILINKDDKSPYITNDGVSIAESIESDDIKVNTVLDIIKESSLKTNEEVGDGTTTTLVLLESIINDGLNEIKDGKNAFILKTELNNTLDKVINEINKLKMKPTNEDLLNISITSSNDKEIGNIVFESFNKMKSKYAIKTEENNDINTYYEIKKGYTLDIDNISNLYFTNDNKIELNNSYLLILRSYLENLEQISDIINECYERNKNIVILCEDFNENINNQILLFKLQENRNIFLFKTPDYGSRRIDIEEDLSILSNSIIKDITYENVSFNDLGKVENIIITKNNITIVNDNNNIKRRIKSLKSLLKENISNYDKEFIESRLSYLTKGILYIHVGGKTRTEIKEKMMRYEDALNAISNANEGITYGEGITYLKVSEILNEKIISEKIIKNALQKPFQRIFENAGLNYLNIKKEIVINNYEKIYNFETNNLESINNSKIIDPIKVELVALKNAVSIASILLTTNYLVINESINNKKTEF